MHDSLKRIAVAVVLVSTMGSAPPRLDQQRVPLIEAAEFTLAAPVRAETGSSQLRLRNTGVLDHHVRLLRLDSARSFREFERALVEQGAVPKWAEDVGGFESIAGGATSTTTIRLSAGVHVLICIARLSDGTPMAMKGMYRQIDIGPSPRSTGNPG